MLDPNAPLDWEPYDLPPRRSHLKLLPKEPTQEELPLDAPVVPVPPKFLGATFDASHDQARLETALIRVKQALETGEKWTLAQLAAVAMCSEAGASARLRDCRRIHKMHVVSERVRGGLWRYYLVVP